MGSDEDLSVAYHQGRADECDRLRELVRNLVDHTDELLDEKVRLRALVRELSHRLEGALAHMYQDTYGTPQVTRLRFKANMEVVRRARKELANDSQRPDE